VPDDLGDEGLFAQAVVDADHQVIVATAVNTNASDVANLIPMPAPLLADAGYCSSDNLEQAADFTATHGTDFFIATGRHRRGDPPPVAPRGRIPADATGCYWPPATTYENCTATSESPPWSPLSAHLEKPPLPRLTAHRLPLSPASNIRAEPEPRSAQPPRMRSLRRPDEPAPRRVVTDPRS
jgi:hypothetical protein